MSGSATSTPYLRFALISFGAVALVAGALAFAGSHAAGSREKDAAARSAASLLGEPLRALFADADRSAPASGAIRSSADALAFTLGAGGLRGFRIVGDGEVVLYEGGARLPAPGSSPGDGALSSATVTAEGGASLFLTRLGADGYSIEIATDSAPVNDAVRAARVQVTVMALAFAAGVWVLLQGAFWFGIRSLSRDHGRLTELYDSGEHLRSSVDLHDVLTQLAQDAATIGGGQYALVALFDEATSEVVLRATFDRSTGTVAHHQRAIDEWFVRRCVATNTPVVSTLSETAARQFFGGDAPLAREAPLVVAPMAIRDRVVGALAIVGSHAGRGAFSPSEVRLVEQLAGQAVTAVEQSILFAKVRSDAGAIEESYDATLKALMAALDAKDELTEGHSERVARLTLQLARQMEVPDAMMVHIERGAMLHDVGKIGVPDAILKKPAALSDTEWEAMRKHPLLAGLMVSKVGFLEPALPILLYHHEKFNGTGYPFGLAGGNIPLEARIFTIVDAYDAMTQDRPYRDAMSHFEAMEEIRRHDGTQFDPDVVAAFEQLMATRADLRGGGTTTRRVLGTHDLEDGHADEHVA